MAMASDVLRQHHCHFTFSVPANCCFSYNNSSLDFRLSKFKCPTKCARGCNSTRFRTALRACRNELPSTVRRKPKPRVANDSNPDPSPDPKPNTHFVMLRRLWDDFRLDGLGMEIISIALPAALALAADPIASLTDTGFIGHLGSTELAAVGVSGAVFNLVSKLFNVPLLNITTSFVAEEQACLIKADDDYGQPAKGFTNA